MSTLAELLDIRCVELELHAQKKEGIFTEMANLLAKAGKIDNPDLLVTALMEREKLVSTGIGDGIAIPHAMIDEVEETMLAVGRRKEGLPFDALDGNPVNLIFLIVGSTGQELLHLQLLSRLVRLLRDPRFRDLLMRAEKPEDVLDLLRIEESREI